MKTIKVDITDMSSIDNMISELKAYRESLNSKLEAFVSALVQDGVQVANISLGSTVGDSTNGAIGYGIDNKGDIVTATIQLNGSDALFIEFGSGIMYNTGTQHPLADEFGYGPGTYPSKHPPNKAINPGYWFYREDGKLIKSIGIGASMPIYHAAETMRNNVIMRATELLKG